MIERVQHLRWAFQTLFVGGHLFNRAPLPTASSVTAGTPDPDTIYGTDTITDTNTDVHPNKRVCSRKSSAPVSEATNHASNDDAALGLGIGLVGLVLPVANLEDLNADCKEGVAWFVSVKA